MIRFKLTENDLPVIDFDNSATGIAVQASIDDMRRWRRIMVQFNAAQIEMRKALDGGLGIEESIIEEPQPETQPEPIAQPPPEIPPHTSNGAAAKITMPVETPQPAFHKATATLVTQTVKLPEEPAGVETVAYNSKGYQGSGKLIMDTNHATGQVRPEVQSANGGPAAPVRRGPGRPRQTPKD